MAVGKGSINRVSKAVDDKVVAPVEEKKATPAKAEPVKKTTTVTKKPTTPKKTTTTRKTTAAKKPAAKKTPAKATTVTKPSAQVEKIIGKKDVHYGVGSTLPTFLM